MGSMTRKNNFIPMAFGLIMNLDKIVGGEFEKDMTKLKEVTTEGLTSK